MLKLASDKWVQDLLSLDPKALENTVAAEQLDPVRIAFLTYLQAKLGEVSWTEAEKKVVEGVEVMRPYPGESVLKILINALQIELKARLDTKNINSAIIAFDQLESDLPPTLPSQVRAYLWFIRSVLEAHDGLFEISRVSLDRALELAKEGSALWYALKTSRICNMQAECEHSLAQAALEELRDYPQYDPLVMWSLPLIEARLCLTIGPLDRGLELLKEIRERNLKVNPRTLATMRLWMLIHSGQLIAAEAAVNEAKMAISSEQMRYMFQSAIALSRADTKTAHRYAQMALSMDDDDGLCETNCMIMVAMAHLVDRHAVKARKMLERIDRHPMRREVDQYWMRLEMLEGNEESAIKRLVKLLRQLGPEGVRITLRWAHELSASQLARIWSCAEAELLNDKAYQMNWVELAAPPNKDFKSKRSTETLPKPAMVQAKNAIARRQRLNQLFLHYSKLTRSQVAELLECAPATAAKDLSSLENDGIIKRIDTSAHARTSYYQRVD